MGELSAVRHAIDLLHVPSRIRPMRDAPLPTGMELLLRIAAGDHDAIRLTSEALSRPPEVIAKACGFFIEQVLLAPESDSFRVLGGRRETSTGELRRNMALLARFLHPDVSIADSTVFTSRVTLAWNDVKTDERRQAYLGKLAAPVARADGKSRARLPRSVIRARSNGRQVALLGKGQRWSIRSALNLLFGKRPD